MILIPQKMAKPEDMASAMKEHSLADVIHDIGYAFTASIEVCKNHMLNFGSQEPTTIDVAKIISMMIRYRANSQDGPQIQMPGNFWMGHEKDTASQGMGEWNAEVFVQSLKELAPNLDWKDVILKLDHQQFIVPDRAGLNLLFTILWLGLRNAGYPPNIFPVKYLFCRWTNLEGQMSLVSNILKHPDIFCFADHPFNQVSIEFLKTSPETENKVVGTWQSLHLVELLLYASEQGFYVLVTELFKTPLQQCPDVLLLVLMQINPPITSMRQELLKMLIPIFLGDHTNAGMILCRAWHSQTLNVKPIIMHAMADWYLRGECDHFRLSRILDIAQDLKALSLLLNMQSYPFVIDLASLASRREYLKLDKWLTDKIRDNGETFIVAMVQFMQKRCPILNRRPDSQVPKAAQLPHETITTMLACLQMCIPNVQQELQEAIYSVIADYQTLIMNKTRYARNLGTPNESVGLGAQLLAPHVDSVAMLAPNMANMSLGAATNNGLPIYGGMLSGSPSKPVSTMNSPSARMPIQYNPNVANTGMLGRVTPAMALENRNRDPIPYPEVTHKPNMVLENRNRDPIPYPEVMHNVAKEIEDEANGYFKRIYNHPAHQSLSIDEVLDMLKKFQDSPNKREREVFSYMLQNLFEEYKFFPQYPDKELHTTAQLFGGIIEKGLVPSYVSLGLALGFVLDALKKGEGTKMYYFGIAALDRFKSRLKDYHKYCEHVRAIPYFNKFPRYLIEHVEYGLKSQEPPAKPQGPVMPENHAPVMTQNSAVAVSASYRSIASTPSASEMMTAGAVTRPSIANVTNINTLLTATENSQTIMSPPEAVQDKTAFIFNNLSQLNLQTKCEELKKIITEEYFSWLSRYLVMNRVSIELNFHTLYANFLDVFKEREVNRLVTKETYRNIKVLLRSDKEISNFTDRSLLKNFGHWLGLLTLARNLPIFCIDIDLKGLLLEAYHRGRQDLLYIVPFVAKVLQSCSKSVVFKPPNPWTMALMNVLAELHEEPNLELNLKFEVEVLCKNLSLDVADLKPAIYLKDTKKLETIRLQLSSQPIKQQEAAGAKPNVEARVSPQPMKLRQEPASAAMAMSVNQAIAPTPMMQQAEPMLPNLVPNETAFMSVLGLPEPRFNYHDINVTSTAIGHNILFNPNIILLQNYPHLKQLAKPAIERSIQEWIHPVVDRAIKYALTTCEQIIRKDFALDPDEMRMRTCAHHMMRNLTAGMAMITCREQITLTMSANLKAAFTAALIPATPHQDAIEDAATTLAADNMELACAFIQKTAVEKALPEVDKCLASDYEIRKLAREEGRRYYDSIELTYQSEMIPERCRARVGAPNELQISVYEEFARNIPGFAPVTDTGLFSLKPPQEVEMNQHLNYNPVMTPTQVYGTDEINALITAAEMFLGSAVTAALGRPMHALLECLCLERRNRDLVSRCTLLQKAVEGLMHVSQPATADLETTRYRDLHLRTLKLLEAVYGLVWTSKQVTGCLAECREEIRYNVEAVDCLIRNGLVNMPQYDIALTHMIDNGNNFAAVAFAMQLVQLHQDENLLVTESDLHHTKDTLTRVMTHSRQLEGLAPSIETARADTDPSVEGKRSLLGPTAHIHSEILQVRSKTYDDPPGLKEKTENFLKEWNNFLLSPLTEINLQKNFNLYIHHMNMNSIFSSNDMTTRFLRIATRICIENVYEELSKDTVSPPSDPARRENYYVMCDSFVKLVSMMIRTMESGNPTPKLNLLNKVLGIITGCLLRDHEERGTSFQQLPYHRLLLMLLFDMTLEPSLDSINCQVLTSFCHTLHIVRPAAAAGFSFSWLEIVSHRVVIDRVVAGNPQQKGWGMYSTLIIDLFKFLDPFLRNNEVAPPVMTLYKGTLKVLLVLLHDFPEFLCDYHYAFCDVISPNCIQMRNLVLSAFPRNMRMPDPFTPNLKVDLLMEIALPPRSVVNYATMLPNTQFKKELDTYLTARAPVTFLSELRRHMQVVNESVRRYNSQLMNAVVLYVGTQAIASIRAKGDVPRMATIAHSAYMDIFQNISVDFDDEGRYLFLNAIANQLRYPNSHTHYFSCVLLYLFAEANSETIQVQITRMLLERLIVNRPHPWGLLITFIELIKNPVYKFWQREFVNYVPEIEQYEKLPSLYNYIVEKVICKISGRRDHVYNDDVDN